MMNDPRQQGNSGMVQARSILIDAVDRVIQIATASSASQRIVESEPESSHGDRNIPSCIRPSGSGIAASRNDGIDGRHQYPSNSRSDRGEDTTSTTKPIQEHRRLFRYGGGAFQPPKSLYSGKGKGKNTRRNRGRPASSTWKKDCICLREMTQTRKPSAEEKMQLARLGLGLEEVCFDCDGDAEHIHSSLAWPDRFFPYIGWGKKGLVQLQ